MHEERVDGARAACYNGCVGIPFCHSMSVQTRMLSVRLLWHIVLRHIVADNCALKQRRTYRHLTKQQATHGIGRVAVLGVRTRYGISVTGDVVNESPCNAGLFTLRVLIINTRSSLDFCFGQSDVAPPLSLGYSYF